MYVHVFEVTIPDGTVVHTTLFQVAAPGREARVRHRMIEVQPEMDPDDDGTLAVAEDYEWEDFCLDEED
jgi:hypothetical protein